MNTNNPFLTIDDHYIVWSFYYETKSNMVQALHRPQRRINEFQYSDRCRNAYFIAVYDQSGGGYTNIVIAQCWFSVVDRHDPLMLEMVDESVSRFRQERIAK